MAGEDAKDDGAHEVDGSAATIACVIERKRPRNCIPPNLRDNGTLGTYE